METTTQFDEIIDKLQSAPGPEEQNRLLSQIDENFSRMAEDGLGVVSFFSAAPKIVTFVTDIYKSGRSDDYGRDFLMALHEFLSLSDTFAALSAAGEDNPAGDADPVLADLPDEAADAFLTLDYLLSWNLRRDEYFADLSERKLLSADYSLALISEDERFEASFKKTI